MKKILLLALLLIVPFITASWYDTGFIYKKNLVFSNPYQDFVNFPLLVQVNTSQYIINQQLQSDCDDIIFTNQADSLVYPYNWENRSDVAFGCNGWNSLIWVKSNISLSNTTQSIINLYHNKSTATNNESTSSAFSDFVFWYTFESNTSRTPRDRTGKNHNLTILGTHNISQTFTGYGLNLTSDLDPYSSRFSIQYQNDINFSKNWTIGLNLKINKLSTLGGTYLFNKATQSTKNSFLMSIQPGSYLLDYNFLNGTLATNCDFTTTFKTTTTNTALTQSAKKFLVVSYNGTRLNIYIDGVLDKSIGLIHHCDFGGQLAFNMASWTNASQSGEMDVDNVFFINTTLSSGTIKAMYDNQFGNFYRLDSELFYNVTFTTPVLETETNTIILNYSYDPSLWSDVLAVLVYNNTEYTPAETESSGNSIFTNIQTAPIVSSTTSFPLYYELRLTNATGQFYKNTTTYYQVVNPFNTLNITQLLCNDRAFFFDFKDERNFTRLNADVYYNFNYGIGSGNTKQIFGNFTNIQNFSICINSSVSYNWIIGQGEIHYFTNGYMDRRYYVFDDTVINNKTVNITLYNIPSYEQTSFKLQVEDNSLIPLRDKFTKTLRWHPELNEYLTVEMGRTDILGTTVIHVETEDVDYRIGVYERNGTLIKLDDPTRMLCLVNPCTYTLRYIPSSQDYISQLGITYTFSYTPSIKIFRFIYSDDSGRTTLMNMTVFKQTKTNSYSVCSSSSTGATGVMICNITTYGSGEFKATVRRESGGLPVTIATKTINTETTPFQSSFGLMLSLIIAFMLVGFMTFVGPVYGLVAIVLSLIPALYFGVFGQYGYLIFGSVIAMAFIIGHMIARSNQ